ncbi:hypothetical protein COO60DRAFT_1476657 [Scenedesmus sp. NREL 46B-D3]|nr:hypothetical protein COO60DRAFT_1476657 [Scenedesmus sp. NREL 46B-D3]
MPSSGAASSSSGSEKGLQEAQAALQTPTAAAASAARRAGNAAGAPAGSQPPARLAAVPGNRPSAGLLWHPAVGSSNVCIAVAVVEGAHALQQMPDLARSTHLLLHRLMLQLLARHFPGSYLAAADPDQLRYSAAFSSIAAAAAWCLTLQEASLYLPYPDELLSLPGCGVQLDGAGRLVLRGPRLQLGLCGGSPSSIAVNSMGRAEYAGAAVQHAHRFADAIAQGGQVVTRLQLANELLQQWQGGTGSAGSNEPAKSGAAARRMSGDTADRVSSALRTVRSLPANISAMLSQQTLHLDPQASARLAAATADGSPAQPGPAALAPTPAAGAGTPPAGVYPSSTQPATTQSLGTTSAADTGSCVAVGATVPVECQVSWLGSFLFRGSHGLAEVAALSPVVLLGRLLGQNVPAAAAAGVPKAQCVVQRGGVLGRGSMWLPASLVGWGAD